MVSEPLHNKLTHELAQIEHELFRLEAAVSRQRDWIDWNEQRAQARYVSRDMLTTLEESLTTHRERRVQILRKITRKIESP
jgi:cob(I)alamin adenosyltransferase